MPRHFVEGLLRVLFVSLNNALHQLMAHDVLLAKLHSGNPFDTFKNPQRVNQARCGRAGQVDLRHIAGDNHF